MTTNVSAPQDVTRVRVAPQSDFLQQQAKATPLQALAECIWNSLDADATRVDVEINRGVLGLETIVVRDNGKAMTREAAPELFGKLGDSWKRRASITEAGRVLHGSEGRGRYKVIALGRVADWRVVYKAASEEFRTFTATLMRDDPRDITFTMDEIVKAQHSGVELTISEPLADFTSLQSDDAPQALAEIFATYLRNYPTASISLQGKKVDWSSAIASTKEYNLSDITDEDRTYPVRLEIIEWKKPTKRLIYLCDHLGFPVSSIDVRWHVGEHSFSTYLRSSFIRIMSDRNEIGLGEMNSLLAIAIEESRQKIKDHFRRKSAELAQSVVNDWKADQTYPYKTPAITPVEEVEREVFDIVAVTATRYLPDFASTSPKARAFQLHMMKTAIENGSDELQLILKEVLNLPAKKQEELAQLLQETSLLSIIGASKVVADRLRFLTALEAIIFDADISSVLRERTQLHRILADHTWIFGEEYHMMVDDRSLNECLAQHYKIATGQKAPRGAVKHPSKARGIVDLMFGRQRRLHRATDLEHLIVELKSPIVAIGPEEITQVEGYMRAIANDSRFDKSTTRWTFWALSKEIDEDYVRFRQQRGEREGTVIAQPNMTAVVRSWSQIISENKARMQFFQESLQHNVTKADALASLKRGYEKVFAESRSGSAIDAVTSSAVDATPVEVRD